jgi:hypothetical protein
VNQERKATTTAKTNTGILRLRCSQSAVSNFAQDDEVFRWSKKEQLSNSNGKNNGKNSCNDNSRSPSGMTTKRTGNSKDNSVASGIIWRNGLRLFGVLGSTHQYPGDRRGMNLEQPSGVRGRLFAFANHSHDLGLLLVR